MADGPLGSDLLKGNTRLQNCAQSDPFHVMPGEPESEHVRLIQEALRQVANATIPATEKNYGPETTKAVVAFKSDRDIFTRGTSSIDPIVGINTIRKLDELLQGNDERKRRRGGNGELGAAATILPVGPITGECNLAGFSAARLTNVGGDAEWPRRDPFRPITQMLPVGQMRKLLVKAVGGASVSFRVDAEQIATIAESDQGSVTVRGQAPGRAVLTVSVEGFQPVLVQLVVRAAKSIPLDVFHLGRPAVLNAPQAFQNALLPGLNALYQAQANLTFTAGATGFIETMMMDNARTFISTGMPIFFSSVIGPPVATRPTFRFADLQGEVKNGNAVTVFISPNIRDQEKPTVVGRGGLRTKVAWFKIGFSIDASKLTVPSHEIGHSLGLQHIKAPRNETFLMNPAVQVNNLVIPSETLVDMLPL